MEKTQFGKLAWLGVACVGALGGGCQPGQDSVGTNPGFVGSVVGASLYSENLCNACHGDDASGGIVQKRIRGVGPIGNLKAMKSEVHRGISLDAAQAAEISAFLLRPSQVPPREAGQFGNPEFCRICHPRQYEEWVGTMMSYGASSPVFSALELLGNRITGGLLARDPEATDDSDLFCQRCHNPVDVALGNLPTFEQSAGRALAESATPLGARGISCDVCHQVTAPDFDRHLGGDLGDGIANAALNLRPGSPKQGPIANPGFNPVHDSAANDYLSSSDFCGACHDVRPRGDDVVDGTDFQRLENLFTEWQQGPYGPIDNRVGRVVSCQDCHMSLAPQQEPGTYPVDTATVFPRPQDAVERRVSKHYFTGVDVALVDFPGQDVEGQDSHGSPIGQLQRRNQLLESAARIELSAPASVSTGGVLRVSVDVTNIGAGHNIPSGFSQERQMWVELIVHDANGDVLYESGTLRDSAHPETGETTPDGRLHDEDLQNLIVELDPVTGEATTLEHGSDYNERRADPPVNRGLINFGNEFVRIREDGGEEEVFVPFLANHMDNGHSIPPLETVPILYDVPVEAGAGPLIVSARLRFRAFPPRFLRLMAQVAPELVNETIVDRNRIVDMASAPSVLVAVD